MLDDLRNSAVQSYEDDLPAEEYDRQGRSVAARQTFMGMTAPQRFVLSLLLFFTVCMLGAFFLVLTETVWLPIF